MKFLSYSLLVFLISCSSLSHKNPANLYGRYEQLEVTQSLSSEISYTAYAIFEFTESSVTVETYCEYKGFEKFQAPKLRAIASTKVAYNFEKSLIHFLSQTRQEAKDSVAVKKLDLKDRKKIYQLYKNMGMNLSPKDFDKTDFNFKCSASINEGFTRFGFDKEGRLTLTPISETMTLKKL